MCRDACRGVLGGVGIPEGPELWRGVRTCGRGLTPLATTSPGLDRANSGQLEGLPGRRALTVHTEVTGTIAGIQVSALALLAAVARCWVRALAVPPVGAVEPTG